MVRLLALVLALAPAAAYAQSSSPPPLDTVTGAGAITTTKSTIKLTTPGATPTTTGITSFTSPGWTVTRWPVKVTSNGITYITTTTATLFASTARPNTLGTNPEKKSGSNRGAIAGGVIGACAVIIAVVATILWFRRRSPAHWKAKNRGWRNIGAGSKPPLLPTSSQTNFHTAEDKQRPAEFEEPQHSVADLQNPFNDPVSSPPPALYIREHRQPVHDPFADPAPESPTSPTRPAHKRGASSVNPLLPSSN
ncbi:hypothetical protein D9611_000212 [Ephemerocybe angulata]|uniref:Uncharacterized protein n=1 Tax=Ephemerocybe angulata TaxID=980116 RepID=A0A8H5BP52_9AGAR|nr:hypothetical protein D9611_000212 [Tulosesus angulatus]